MFRFRQISNKSSEDGLGKKTGKERGDFDTDYDSTWEDDNDNTESEEDVNEKENTEKNQGNFFQWGHWAERNEYAAKDMQNFRHMLRKTNEKAIVNIQQRQKDLPNLWFYQNKKPSGSDGVFIEEFHDDWFGDYKRLERTHSYIQWLFPIQEKGMNWDSYILQEEEIKLFREDVEVKKRLVKSYKLMLDFYGIRLLDEKTGKVCRIKLKWKERFDNLNRNTHNNLRITRILKCLGILGFQHYQAPLVKFFLHQTLVKERLPRVKQSALDYFLFSVVDKKERRKLIKYAFQTFQTRKDFVWCPKRIQRRFLKEINQQITEDNDSDLSEPESDAEAEGNFSENEENEDTSFSNTVDAVQSNSSDGEVGVGNLIATEAGLSRNAFRNPDTHPQQNMRRMEDSALSTNVMASTENDTAGAGAVMHSGTETAPLSDNMVSTEEQDGTDTSPQNDDVSSQHSAEVSSSTHTPNQSDSAMSASSSAEDSNNISENHGVHERTLRPDIPLRPDNENNTDDQGKDIVPLHYGARAEAVPVVPDGTETSPRNDDVSSQRSAEDSSDTSKNHKSDLDGTNKENNSIIDENGAGGAKAKGVSVLQDGTNSTNQTDSGMSAAKSSEISNQMSDDHGVPKPTAKNDTKTTRDDALRQDIVPPEPDNTDDLEGSKNTQSSEKESVAMSEDQSVQKSTATEHKGRTGDDSQEPGISSNENNANNAMESSGGDTEEVSLVGDIEMSDNQESDQRREKDPPTKDDDDEMETEGNTETAQNILPNVDGGAHPEAMPGLQSGTDTTHLSDSPLPGQNSTVESDEMSDNLENDQRLDQDQKKKR
ncbi:opioid growth factor receptor-like isoform X5 [Astyanax mexicanus]|uniref:opioid growth factor receptor-like isoform X4 n=2 Tax=Astyanax mexicanus TaxID=7994 RepID=UPI0020CB6253|nr:opioid growth factor receptor-like isoform X4 [Astyanax mexicanus]XP_049327713.1 opioid growth factor receptor-like isoform X5 [Astyanax mexicanus]